MSNYFIIFNSDGDTYVSKESKDELLKSITPNEYGDTDFGKVEFLQDVPKSDTNYWGDGLLIIKGEIVIPEVKEAVSRYDIK